jgi:hypothetical protein
MGELIDKLVRRRADGGAPTQIRLSPRAWDRIISEVGEQDGLIATDGRTRSFLGTPVTLDETAAEVDVH